MNDKPTFDPTALSDEQRDGTACVVCGLDYVTETTPTPHVPAGMVDGAQVFACVSHVADDPGDVDPAESAAALDRLAAKYGVTQDVAAVRAYRDEQDGDEALRERAARRATWPDGEPDSVRDMARRGDLARRADDLARQLEVDLGDVRDVDLATAVRAAITAMRDLGDACRSDDDEQLGRALDDSSATLRRLDGVITDRERRAE